MVPVARARPHTRAQQAGRREFPWLSVLLLAFVHLSLAWSLDVAGWAEGLHVTVYAVMAGILVGSLLAISPWPRGFVRLYTLVTGMALTLYLGSTLITPATGSIDQAITVLDRIARWMTDALLGKSTGDNLVFVVDVTFLIWWVSVTTVVGLVREHKVWEAVVPTGIALSVNAYYAAPDLTGFVLVYLGATLLLLVTSHLYEQVAIWEQEHVRYPLDVAYVFLRNGLLFSLLILLFAWYAPKVVGSPRMERWLDPAKKPWHRLQEEWTRIFNTLNYSSQGVIPAFGSTLTFRGAPNLSDTPYFTIKAKKGRYWRAAVYDYYRGSGWSDTLSRTKNLSANEGVRLPLVQGGEILTQTVTVELPGAVNLVAAPMALQFSLPVEAKILEYKGQLGGGEEILFAYTRRVLRPGESYSVVSYVLDPDATSLRNAGTDYPDWIRDHYLQLPSDFPERVRQLARDLTAAYDNPYDKAKAIERYLRSIPYNEEIPMPPRDQDGVDWFLFDLQQGYCDYYASAMAVMLRAVGVPARIASGYARGEYDEQAHTWTVRESDAHTWPEVYFPGYGWIQFEPTPSEPPLERRDTPPPGSGRDEVPGDVADNPDREAGNIPKDEEAFGTGSIPVPFLPVRVPLPRMVLRALRAVPWRPMLGLAVLFALLYQVWRFSRRRLLTRPDLPVVLYTRLVRWGKRLGAALTPAQTPAEHRERLVRMLPSAQEAVASIVSTYEMVMYAPASLRDRAATRREELLSTWEHLWPRLWWEWLRRVPRRLRPKWL